MFIPFGEDFQFVYFSDGLKSPTSCGEVGGSQKIFTNNTRNSVLFWKETTNKQKTKYITIFCFVDANLREKLLNLF